MERMGFGADPIGAIVLGVVALIVLWRLIRSFAMHVVITRARRRGSPRPSHHRSRTREPV